jgi:hypothetical protein
MIVILVTDTINATFSPISRSLPLGVDSFGIGRHFICQILASDDVATCCYATTGSAAEGRQYLAVKMAANTEAVSD